MKQRTGVLIGCANSLKYQGLLTISGCTARYRKRKTENMKLAEFIKEYDERFNHILGYRRMTSWINHFNHTDYKPKRVHRIMKKLGIHSVIRKKKKKYTSSAPESIAENKLGRDFYACAPNEKWATDVTEFKVPDESKNCI